MDSSRRQKGYNYKQEMQRTGSYNKRPPMGSWHATVPSWEKKFCTTVGSISWHKLLDTKKYMHLYDNVVQWNDSASEEAFNNAKKRFWAEINGLPCDISLPSPDIYIDEIDWNSKIDPELILDLERDPDPITGEDEEISNHNSLLLLNQPVACTGWGDEEEDQGKATNSLAKYDRNVGNNDNPWDSTWGLGKCENNIYDSENFVGGRTNGMWGTRDWNQRKGEGDGWNMSRYKTSRFHGDDYWRNEKWSKTVNHVYEERRPTTRQWKVMNSCQPLNHGSGRARHSWNLEKPVA